MSKKINKKCPICGKTKKMRVEQETCSRVCASELRAIRTREKVCPECGEKKIFERSDYKYCSDKCRESARNKRNKSSDNNIFDIRDSDLRHYIIGFIYCDGSLTRQEGKSKRITVGSIDEKMIKKIASTISPKRKLYIREPTLENHSVFYSTVNNNKKTVEGLENIGLTKNKSVTIGFPDRYSKIGKDTISFLRGVFDADGSVFIDRGYKFISISCGSYDFAKGLVEILEKYKYHPKIVKEKRHSCYYVKMYRQKEVTNFRDRIYKNESICIKRKKDKFYDDIV